MEFKVLDFSEDIIDGALKEVCDKCIMVFPTRISADLARLRFEPRWNLEAVQWLAMEDFKAILLASDQPLMQDEKRLLSLYQVLDEEDKQRFHIWEYNDVIEWGTNLFQFMQEFSEAGKALDDLLRLGEDKDLYLRAWQEDQIGRIHAILQRYLAFIANLGFTDAIFSYPINNLHVPFQGYRIVFVNQFYYSKLEQYLVRSCEEHQNQVIIYYHGVNPDPQNWQMPQFEPKGNGSLTALKEKVKIFECESEEQAALVFLALNSNKRNAAIVDSSFWNKPYSKLFPENIVAAKQQFSIVQSQFYTILCMLKEIAASQINTPGFVPLRILSRFFMNQELVHGICKQWNAIKQEQLRREIFSLADEEVLYLDFDIRAQFGNQDSNRDKYSLLPLLCETIFAWARGIINLQDLADLAKLFTEKLNPEVLCSENELAKTDVLEQFWTALANFSATESLGIVQKWYNVFEHPGFGIFALFMDFLKPIQLKYSLTETINDCWEVTNILDSRNRSFKHLAFMQMVEGVLPQTPGAVWLLNEAQRARLGLLSYEVIRNWERYYFYRLVMCAEQVQIFTYRNMEMNVKPSSFVMELQELCQAELSIRKIPVKRLFEAYANLEAGELKHKLATSELMHAETNQAFCSLPSNPAQDFLPKHQIRFNSYDVSLLFRNAFVWYIQSVRKIKPLRTDLAEKLSNTLFGNLMHAYFTEILGSNPQSFSSVQALRASFTNDTKLRIALQSLMNSSEFYYKIPKNYNEEFLADVIGTCLSDSLKQFFYRFLSFQLQNKAFELFPEGSRPEDERYYKEICKLEFAGKTYSIQIKGRADLRILTDETRYIIDFKTGSADSGQLVFYEWYYDLIDHHERAADLRSYFWMVLDRELNSKDIVRAAKRDSFAANIQASLLNCFNSGYNIGKKSSDRHLLKSISRSDIFVERQEG